MPMHWGRDLAMGWELRPYRVDLMGIQELWRKGEKKEGIGRGCWCWVGCHVRWCWCCSLGALLLGAAGAKTPVGNGSLPPVMSLCGFVALSRAIISPAWLCPRPRMVGTGGLQVGAGGWSVGGAAWLDPL